MWYIKVCEISKTRFFEDYERFLEETVTFSPACFLEGTLISLEKPRTLRGGERLPNMFLKSHYCVYHNVYLQRMCGVHWPL